jgi:uncharacterized protein
MTIMKPETLFRRLAVGGLAAGLMMSVSASAKAADGFKFVWASGSVGGTYNIIVTAVAERLKAEYPGTNVDIIPGGSVTNTIRLGQGEFPFAMINLIPAMEGYKGILEVKGEKKGPYDQIRGVARIYNSHFQFVAPADLPADTIDEVIEKKLKITIVPGGPRGHIGVLAMEKLLDKAFGIDFKAMEAWGAKIVYAEFGDTATMIRDGQVQLFTPLTAAPNGALLDLANARPVKFLGMSERSLKVMEEQGFISAPLPANTYPGQTADVMVTAATDGFYARADADPALVEAVTRTLLKNEGYLKTVHVRLKEDFDGKEAFKGLAAPLHPASEKVYREFGYIK